MFPALRHRLCRGLVRFPPSATASAEAWFAFRPSPMARFNVDKIVDVNVRLAFLLGEWGLVAFALSSDVRFCLQALAAPLASMLTK